MADILLYKFNKDENSTKVPSSYNHKISGLFMAQTSIMYPSIIFDLNYEDNAGKLLAESIRECNYAFIAEFGNRYYFIKDWIFDGKGLWVAQMAVDVLATYKTAIGTSEQYVIRSASAYNQNITDALYNTKGITTLRNHAILWGNQVTGVVDISYGNTGKKIILGMTNAVFENSQVTPHTIAENNFTTLGSQKYLAINNQGAFYLEAEIHRAFQTTINALQYVTTYHILPFEPDFMDDSSSYADLVVVEGNNLLLRPQSSTALNGRGAIVTSPTVKEVRLYLPTHPQSASRGAYLNKSEYTRITMNFPAFGSFEINTDFIYESSVNVTNYSVLIRTETDITTGDSALYIIDDKNGTSSEKKIVAQIFGNISIPLLLSQNGRDIRRIANTIFTGIMGVASGVAQGALAGSYGGTPGAVAGGVVGGVLSAVGAVGSTITSDAFLPQQFLMKGGGQNNIATKNGKIEVSAEYKLVTDDFNERFGRPLCEKKKINTLSGIVVCQAPHVHTNNMLAEEQTLIQNYMTGGIFYE